MLFLGFMINNNNISISLQILNMSHMSQLQMFKSDIKYAPVRNPPHFEGAQQSLA
jgi:hypothetical protein